MLEHHTNIVLTTATRWVKKLNRKIPFVFGNSVSPYIGYQNDLRRREELRKMISPRKRSSQICRFAVYFISVAITSCFIMKHLTMPTAPTSSAMDSTRRKLVNINAIVAGGDIESDTKIVKGELDRDEAQPDRGEAPARKSSSCCPDLSPVYRWMKKVGWLSLGFGLTAGSVLTYFSEKSNIDQLIGKNAELADTADRLQRNLDLTYDAVSNLANCDDPDWTISRGGNIDFSWEAFADPSRPGEIRLRPCPNVKQSDTRTST